MRYGSLSAFLIGFLFSAGLMISQMVNPQKVLNFLDVFGDWDPALILVMATALMVYWICYFLIKPRLAKPLLTKSFVLTNNKVVDAKLIRGACLFGMGWGLTGLCPGPAIANVSGGSLEVLLYVAVLCVTMFLYEVLVGKAG